MHGSDRVLTRTIPSEPRLEKRKPSTRAKWRSSPSARIRVLKECLTPPTLLEMRIYHQQPRMLKASRAFKLQNLKERGAASRHGCSPAEATLSLRPSRVRSNIAPVVACDRTALSG